MRRSRLPKAALRLTTLCAGLILLQSLTACADKPPPVVSGDLSCDRFRHISATQAQIDVIAANFAVMESWVDQVVAHNDEFDKHCVKQGDGRDK